MTNHEYVRSELKKNTKPDHADYGNISKALEQLETVAQSVNERKRQSENRQKILDIIGQVSGVSVGVMRLTMKHCCANHFPSGG